MSQSVREKVRDLIQMKTGHPVADLRPYAAGNNTALYLADLKNGMRLVVKIATKKEARLDIEGWMLEYIRARSDMPVPEVIMAEKGVLVMTCLPSSGVLDAGAERHAADILAALHSVHGPFFGLEKDTLIGGLHQPNTPSQDWLSFFRDHRLLYMAKAAFEEGRIDAALMKSIEKLAGRLDRYIDSTVPPSLLHGDVWGGNVMAAAGRVTGFIDPAIYYGDPEIELAFSTMFGTFGENFFERYNEINPLRDGFFEVRRDLYNLYPLLVHARLFGRTYAESVFQTVHRLAA